MFAATMACENKTAPQPATQPSFVLTTQSAPVVDAFTMSAPRHTATDSGQPDAAPQCPEKLRIELKTKFEEGEKFVTFWKSFDENLFVAWIDKEPQGLLRLPNNGIFTIDKTAIMNDDHLSTGDQVMEKSGVCRDDFVAPEITEQLNGTWAQLTKLISFNLSLAIRIQMREEQRAVNQGMENAEAASMEVAEEAFVTGYAISSFLFPPNGELAWDTWISTIVVKRAAKLFEDEEQMWRLGNWVIPVAASMVMNEQKLEAQKWLKRFWLASHANMTALTKKAVCSKELAEKPAGGGDPCYGFYLASAEKPEGVFLRRYLNVGGGPKGDDLINIHRYWMAKLAAELKMSEAPDWLKEAKAGLAKNKSRKSGHEYK